MKMQESPEDYLEAILVLSRELGNVRSIDVANYLEYSKPSVSVAMKRLRENGFVTLDEHGNLILTGSGLSIALKIYERHLVISQFHPDSFRIMRSLTGNINRIFLSG